MNENVTIPQPFSSPLSLMYKGAFSTYINSHKNSQYGHFLDKLYQIQFLGIGTHLGDIDNGNALLNAVMVSHESIHDRTELFRATPDKYKEALLLEALGARPREREVGENYFKDEMKIAERVNEVKIAERLGLLHSEDKVIKLGERGKQETASLIRLADTVDELMQLRREIKYATEIKNSIEAFRTSQLKEAGTLGEAIAIKIAKPVEMEEGTLADTARAKVAQVIVHELANSVEVKDNVVLLTEWDVITQILRDADIITDALYLTEKIGVQGLIENLPQNATLTPKQTSLAHYLLMQESEPYKDAIVSAITEHITASGVREFVINHLDEAVRGILKEAFTTEDMTGTVTTVESMLIEKRELIGKVVRAAEEMVDRFVGAGRVVKPVSIEFDHEIKAEDSKGYIAILDTLYNDFVEKSKLGYTDSLSFYEGETLDDESLIVNYLAGEQQFNNKTTVHNDNYLGSISSRVAVDTEEMTIAEQLTITNTSVLADVKATKVITKQGKIDSEGEHGEFWSEAPATFVGDSRDTEYLAELTNSVELVTSDPTDEFITASLTSEDEELSVYIQDDIFGELTNVTQPITSNVDEELWGELTSETQVYSYVPEYESFGELTSEPTTFQREYKVELFGTRTKIDTQADIDKEYDIAVFSCTEPDLKYRRRQPLEPDVLPDDPLFEWICTEGYVCDDWLIVPLKDFNFENPVEEGFYDPVTLLPYFPTGQTDVDGDPFVLPPYSILNEPISNGVDVGGKEPMSIDPCNLYSFIEYVVKIYDAYKSRFQASSPIDTVSRVMNMLFEQTQKLIAEWDETKGYTPDELWRVYRFIRWMALGVTNRFYRVKVEYTYGDFYENFESFPFTDLLQPSGASRKTVSGYGWVLEGHPILPSMQNKATLVFNVPMKVKSSTISFEVGNYVPDRPPMLVEGGELFREDFEGTPSQYKIQGTGWVPVVTQSGTGLGIEDPAKARRYRTNAVSIPSSSVSPRIRFNYGIDTNLDTSLTLKKESGEVLWSSSGNNLYGTATVKPVPTGNVYFEVDVPQSESGSKTDITFTAQQIQTEWKKFGYSTEWRVSGNVIYAEENTPQRAMIVNPQWVNEDEYEMEVDFFTEDVKANYGLIDWIGVVLNYRDNLNYYVFGTWSALDSHAKGGLLKVRNGVVQGYESNPTWAINPDFRFQLSKWHKLRAVVSGNKFTIYIDGVKYLEVIDNEGWGFGSCGLATYSNPLSKFRNFRYRGKPRIHAFIDNVIVDAENELVPVSKPKYAVDFHLDGDTPRLANYSEETKRTFSFPILEGEHKAEWVFKKQDSAQPVPQDASFIDNIVVRGIKATKAEVVEEFIGCGGHMPVRLLVENLLEYYRRHHQGCKGERNIWIVE